MPNLIPLDYPLPRRHWYQTANGWASKDWTPAAYDDAKRALFKTDEVRVRPDCYLAGWFAKVADK